MLLDGKVAHATPGPPATSSVPSAGSPSPSPGGKWESILDAVEVLLQELSAAPIQAAEQPAAKITPAAKEMFRAPLKNHKEHFKGKEGEWVSVAVLVVFTGLVF